MAKDSKKSKSLKKDKVSIIILSINSLELVKSVLSDVSKLDTKNINLECVVVDNGSTDNSKEILKKYTLPNAQYKFLRNERNLGFTGGNNVGINYALDNGTDYVLLLNNDMILKSDLVTVLTSFLNKNPKAGAVSPKIYFAKGYEFHKERYSTKDLGKVLWYAGGKVDWNNIYTSHIGVDEVDNGQFNKITKTDIGNGACLLIRSEVLKQVGLLDEDFYLYWEDADFSRRVINADYDVFYNPNTFVWHKVSVSAGGSGSASNDYFLVRNRYFFAMKYANYRAKFAVLRDTIRILFKGSKWQKIGAKDALFGVKGVGSWAK